MGSRFRIFALVWGVLSSLPSWGGEAKVAVAANFLAAARVLAADFQAGSGHRLVLVSGATGQLYAQIVHGAPFDVFLAADEARPRRLETAGLAVAGSRFTYALGRLVLWAPRGDEDPLHRLRSGRFGRLALANPKTAPYGAAARAVLESMELWGRWRDRRVMGQNVAQAFAFVHAGQADLGFVAAAQVQGRGGRVWLVPPDRHPPLRQDAVLLSRGADNPAARAWLAFLREPRVQARLRELGYEVP